MGYLHIDNLYKNQIILLFRECFALEKIHGTSAHIKFTNVSGPAIHFFSGGESHDRFSKLFNPEFLIEKFQEIGQTEITIFGEAYGGKQQGMSGTYGKELKFIAFDVRIGDNWLDVPNAEQIVKSLGLEFVDYARVSTDLISLDKERDKDSTQAIRNGVGAGKLREGVVLRPLIELTQNNGERIICKHKRDEFRETKSARPVIDPLKLEVLKNAQLISNEWATPHRLEHILQKISYPHEMALIPKIIADMVNDIKREGEREIIWSKDAERAIGKKTVELFKNHLKSKLS